MAGALTVTLGVSIFGLLMLLVLKRYEVRTGRVMFKGLRPKTNRFFHSILVFIEQVIPSMTHAVVRGFLRLMRGALQRIVARAILMFEYTLEHVLHRVRQTSQPPPGQGEVSTFLREVAAHKRKLLKRSPKNRAIFEE